MATSSFTWPRDVAVKRVFLPGYIFAYHLTHTRLGELGYILQSPLGDDGCQLECEVCTDGSPALVERRRAVLELLTRGLAPTLCGR